MTKALLIGTMELKLVALAVRRILLRSGEMPLSCPIPYGTAKKSAFTGSAATIKNEKIATRQTSNVTNALAGQVLSLIHI